MKISAANTCKSINCCVDSYFTLSMTIIAVCSYGLVSNGFYEYILILNYVVKRKSVSSWNETQIMNNLVCLKISTKCAGYIIGRNFVVIKNYEKI